MNYAKITIIVASEHFDTAALVLDAIEDHHDGWVIELVSDEALELTPKQEVV